MYRRKLSNKTYDAIGVGVRESKTLKEYDDSEDGPELFGGML